MPLANQVKQNKMNAVKTLFRINSDEFVNSNAKKKTRVFGGYPLKRIQISASNNAPHIVVNYTSTVQGILQIKIHGFTGYEVYAKSHIVKEGINNFDIDCSLFKVGVFIVETTVRDVNEGLLNTYNKIEIFLK